MENLSITQPSHIAGQLVVIFYTHETTFLGQICLHLKNIETNDKN
jgi:hypothetical protein